MSIGRNKRGFAKKQTLAWGALLISALALGGCSTSIADLPLVGTPTDAPARPKVSTPEDDLLEIPAFLRRQAN